MAREVVTKVYTFEELNESAKEKARDWWRLDMDCIAWNDESRESIQAFCDQFCIKLTDWSVGPFAPFHWSADYSNDNFRGLKLRDFERENYPTGYCLDADMSITFYDTFKETGDAKLAFESAMDAGFKGWRNDMEWQWSDEYIDEILITNGYEFTESGKFYA